MIYFFSQPVDNSYIVFENCTIIKQGGAYPRYKALILRTIHRLRENGYMNRYADLTDEEVFKWWTSKQGIKHWYCENKLQGNLFDDL